MLKKIISIILFLVILIVLCSISVIIGSQIASFRICNRYVELCRINLNESIQAFGSYKHTMNTSEYWRGVSSYYTFMCLADTLYEERSFDYIYFNKLYSYLLLYPQKCQNTIDELIIVLSELYSHFGNPNTYESLTRYVNMLEFE